MDIYNPREIGKKTKINDQYWKESLGMASYLERAITNNDDTAVFTLLKNHKVFRGRS